MRRFLRLCVTATVVAFALAANSCGTVAFTGRRQFLIFSDSDITSLSEQSYNDFMKSAKVSTNSAQTKMLNEVGKRMTTALDSYLKSTGQNDALKELVWNFTLVESKEVNAFCLPSGRIVFYEGIMPIADTPDYIAVVMGHEMAHAIAKHGNERMSQNAAMSLFGNVASAAIGANSSSTSQSLFNLGFNVGSQFGVLLPFSRKHEYEADRIGMYIMHIAGYDINAAPEFWKKMSKGKKSDSSDFMSTHPCDDKRIEALIKAIPDAMKFKL